MTSISKVAAYLTENAEFLAVKVVEGVLDTMKLEIPVWEKEQAVAMYVELLGFFGQSLDKGKEDVPQALIKWSKRNAERQVSLGGNISEIVVRYPSTRAVFAEILTKLSIDFGLSMKENACLIKRINGMLDISLNETVFAFERLAEKRKNETQRELAELSAPIVPIQKGVVVLPLIGSIDSYRGAYILEKVVPRISQLQIEHLIVDFSGILTIDVELAHYMHQIGDVLRLLGIHVITTGLRPELAQTVVNSGMDFSSIETYAHVKQALQSINS